MTLSTKPQTLPVQLERIPSCLKESPRWVGWRWTFNPEKPGGHHHGWDKPLLNPRTGGNAQNNNPETWGTYKEAVNFMRRESLDGIGFNLLGYEGLVMHDLDNCRNPDTGEISPQVMNIVRLVGSYWEVTPSGTGIRGISWGQKTGPMVEASKGGPIDGAQYDGSKGRYVTLTGHTLPESTADICDAHPGGIEAAYALMFPEKQREPGPKATPKSVDVDDLTLLDKARNAANGEKFSRLWAGDTSAYGEDDSAADEALCCLLAYWTGGDAARMDRLFHQSGLMRPKWEREDYRARTVQNALGLVTEYYSPNGQHPPGAVNTDGRHARVGAYIPAARKWPGPMAEEAFYGLAGDVVRAIESHTEASREALLINFLAAFGNAAGSGPHALAEADKHGCNIFAVLVGETSKGRKGSSWGHIRELFRRADPEWADNRILGGLSSGEGLIWAVRDPITKTEVVREKSRPTKETITYEADPGVDDKRLLVMEPEFSSVLQVMERETNTLSAKVRQAWDTGDLRTMTKNTPAQATGAHISIIGHITKDELNRHLGATEAANGFGNRFLWVCTKRGRVLPEGGGTPDYNSGRALAQRARPGATS